MKTTIIVCSVLFIFSISAQAIDFQDFSISFSLYPNKMPKKLENGWLVNNQEWYSVSVNFTIGIWQNFYVRNEIKTYGFATKIIQNAPSSTKFFTEVGYRFKHFKIFYSHFCHHYYKQFSENSYSDQDRLVFEYSF